MKLLGAVLILICGSAFSFERSKAENKKVGNARALCELVRLARGLVETFSMCGSDILRRCPTDILYECGYPGGLALESFSQFAGVCKIPDEEMKRLFNEFCDGFGKSYRAEELRRIDYYLSKLESRAHIIEKQAPVKKKTGLVIGVSAAITAVIFLL